MGRVPGFGTINFKESFDIGAALETESHRKNGCTTGTKRKQQRLVRVSPSWD
jgi:hypothetical protein